MAKEFTQTEIDQSALFALKLMLHLYKNEEIDYNEKEAFTKDIFNRLDTNKDGELKYKELKSLAFEIDAQLAEQMLQKHTNAFKRGVAEATNITLAKKADFAEVFPEYINILDKISNTDGVYDGKISTVELVAEIDVLEKKLGIEQSCVPRAIRKETEATQKKHESIKKDLDILQEFYDKDSDGSLSKDELIEMFKNCDKDGNGSISATEIKAAVSEIKSTQK